MPVHKRGRRRRPHFGRSGYRPAVPAVREAAQVDLVLLRCGQPGAVSPRRADQAGMSALRGCPEGVHPGKPGGGGLGGVVHDAVVAAAGSCVAGAGAVAAGHLRVGPPIQFHEVALGAAAVEPGMAEVMPEPVRDYLDAALASPPGDDLADAACGHRAAVTDAEPELRPVSLHLPGADPDVPVEGTSGVVADLDSPGLAALAVDGDLPQLQVQVSHDAA